MAASTAFTSWSGQEVDLKPHLMPESFSFSWSTDMPETSALIPCRFPDCAAVENCVFQHAVFNFHIDVAGTGALGLISV